MAKFIEAIEASFESEAVGSWSDIAACGAFLAVLVASLSWLTL